MFIELVYLFKHSIVSKADSVFVIMVTFIRKLKLYLLNEMILLDYWELKFFNSWVHRCKSYPFSIKYIYRSITLYVWQSVN